jgi:diacylglycerol kinase family enzyme
MSTDLPIILNPHSGSSDGRDAVEETFRAAGARVTILETGGSDVENAVRAVQRAGSPSIGVAGGDGTISAAANVLAGSDTILLPIPLGTFNHFALRYGIGSVEAAARAWQQQSIYTIHVGTANQRVFVNNASCGFYPRAVRLRERISKVFPRSAAMWVAGSIVLARLRLLDLEIEHDGQPRHIVTPALWVGIGRNSLRLPVPGDAQIQQAVLEAVTGHAQTRLAILALAFRLFRHLKRGLEPRDERLEVLRGRSFTVTSHRSIDMALDGEPVRIHGPLKFAIRENALRTFSLVVPTH